MADRELTANEKPGTFIQHKQNGDTGIITLKTSNGYKVDWITDSTKLFVTWSKLKEYVVIQ